MKILSHTPILKQLYEFKISDSIEPPTDLILILMHKQKNIDLVQSLLFQGKNISNKDAKKYLDILVNENMHLSKNVYYVNDKELVKDIEQFYERVFTCQKIMIKNNNKKNIKKAVEENKTEINDNLGKIKIINDELVKKRKKLKKNTIESQKKPSLSLLNFNLQRVESKKEVFDDSLRFKPIHTDPNLTFSFHTKKFYKNFTLRKRRNIYTPVKLTFVKFHDQLRPALYEKIEKIGSRITLKKNSIVDYEADSEAGWIFEEGESVDISESESEDIEKSSDNEWIEKDETEVVRKYEKPEIRFDEVKIEFFKDNEDWLNISLIKKKEFPEELTEKLKNCKGKEDFIVKRFALEYRIADCAVLKKYREVFL